MSRYNRKKHKYNSPLQPVKVDINGTFIYGIIISKFHKLPKGANIEEPYYLVSGIGNAIWEDKISPISDADYKKGHRIRRR